MTTSSDVAYLAGFQDGCQVSTETLDQLTRDMLRLRLANLGLCTALAISGYLTWKVVERWNTALANG